MILLNLVIRCVFLLIGVLQLFIGLRFLLKIFMVQSDTFVLSFVYKLTDPLIAPFLTFLPNSELHEIFTIELASLFALIIYTFLGYFILGYLSKKRERWHKTGSRDYIE